MCVTIRAAQRSDIDPLIDLSRRTIRASYASFLGKDGVEAFIGSGAADDYVRDHISSCLVILKGDQVVGYCVAKGALIDLMMIDHDKQRQGLGSTLLHHAEEVLFKEHSELSLESFEPNEVAKAFYRRHGWREVRRYHDDASGVAKIEFRKGTA